MDILIEKLNGEKKKFSDFGLIPLDILISSTNIRRYTSEVQGRPGTISKGADHGAKTVAVPFIMIAEDLMDFPFARDRLFEWLGDIESFYLYEGRSNGEMYEFEVPGQRSVDPLKRNNSQIIYGKRYLVRRDGAFSLDQTNKWGKSSITFVTDGIPFGESVARTTRPFVITETGDPALDNIWLTGQGGQFRSDLEYVFTGPGTFRVWNGGTEKVDPHFMDFILKFEGESTNLTITNKTNSSRWSYDGTSKSSDVIQIKMLDSYKNNQSITADTDLDILTLAPGWNLIEVKGAASLAKTTFDFRWYWR
ncbi:phage tail domain-containing protein [Terribacillus saccharophilus]|uniref:phage tail domain-containing protein n=1 Tax=Terribacillus saccharophilus TaxID=361277 RepID=UPI0038049177